MKLIKLFLFTLLFTVAINAQSYVEATFDSNATVSVEEFNLQGQWIKSIGIRDSLSNARVWDSCGIGFEKFDPLIDLWLPVSLAGTAINIVADNALDNWYYFTADQTKVLTGNIRVKRTVITSRHGNRLTLELTDMP